MARNPTGPKPSSETARLTMIANRRRDTSIEIAVRKRLHRAGARYRVDFAPDPSDRRRRADIVFTRARVAVFIDGCFWHGCPDHYVEPKSNRDYWLPKIARNRERDQETTQRLTSSGWTVLRFWEHENADDAASAILTAIRRS